MSLHLSSQNRSHLNIEQGSFMSEKEETHVMEIVPLTKNPDGAHSAVDMINNLDVSFGTKHVQHNGCKPGWKPITLRAPVLGGFIIVSIMIIILLEILSHISSGNGNRNGGGLAFAADVNSLPTIVSFNYLYLPTIIAVIYSITWSWVDLDAKRLEPWFQLSKDAGAKASDSLLLQYPFDFLPIIPILAFRRRHWSVCFAGTIMLLVFWVLTPLQSSIFNTGIATRSITEDIGTSSVLVPLEEQTSALNTNFMNTGYGISWLKQKLPPFTTADSATLPFRPIKESKPPTVTETWSTIADTYSTTLNCTPAEVSLEPLGYTFSDGKGCSISEFSMAESYTSAGAADYLVIYVGYYDNPHSDWALANPNCTAGHSSNFLALWASMASSIPDRPSYYSNLTAVFCQPTYHTTQSRVTVNASDGAVLNVIPTGLVSQAGGVGSVFNTSNFEYLIGTGIQSEDARSNYPDTILLEQYPQLTRYNLAWPVSNMVGFAVSLNPSTVADLSSTANLQRAFEKAHQLLFAVAVSTLTTSVGLNSTALKNVRTGLRRDTLGAIVMVRTISIIVEVALVLVIVTTISLWWASYHRRSNLIGDIASTADVMSVVSEEIALSEEFGDDGTLTEDMLKRKLSTRKYFLRLLEDVSGKNRLQLSPKSHGTGELPSTGIAEDEPYYLQNREMFRPVLPRELQTSAGITLIAVIVGSLATLVFLKFWSTKQNGLILPSTNQIILSILENYLPIMFATLLEPVWVILNRLLCLLQPLEDLRRGNAQANTSIASRYTSLPPQTVIWHAITSRHFLLAAVCIIALSNNILAVSLSGLIIELPTTIQLTMNTSQSLLPQIGNDSLNPFGIVSIVQYYDHFYTAMSNLTQNTSLPAWVDQEYFYLPFDLVAPPTASSSGNSLDLERIQGTTFGFGANPTCLELSTDQTNNNSVTFELSTNATNIHFQTSHMLPNGTRINCGPRSNTRGANLGIALSSPAGPSALEIITLLDPVNNADDGGFCTSLLVAGWVRLAFNDVSEAQNGTLSSTFIACTTTLSVAQFEVFVDLNGYVLQSNRSSDFATNTTTNFAKNTNETDLFKQTNNLLAPSTTGYQWHNDSFTSDWMNSLLGFRLQSDVLVNPLAPVPSAEQAITLMQDQYKQLFAILLGLNTNSTFSEAVNSTLFSYQAIVIESRIFISDLMFKITLVILVLQLIVAILYYTHRPKRFLPRMPTSIASIIAFVSASRALEDFEQLDGDIANNKEGRYGYGRSIGIDGRTRVGIEKQRYIVPLENRNPDLRRRLWPKWASKDGKEPRTWI